MFRVRQALQRSLLACNTGINLDFAERYMARESFFKKVYENLRQEIGKDKEMKESLKKFKEEAAKLEQTEALQKARRKFKMIEEESSSKLAENLSKLKEQFGETIEKSKIGEEVSKTAKAAKRTMEDIAQKGDAILSKSETLKVVSQSIEGPRVYRAPAVLLKRSALSAQHKDVILEPNTEAQGLELHRDSKWSQSWENFKNSNPYVNKFMDIRHQLEESENPVIRASKMFTTKVSDLFGGLFETTEMSKVYTEICRVDPTFDKIKFQHMCETHIIPTVLEAMIRPDLDVLRDWMYEAVYNLLATPIKQGLAAGLRFDSKVLDISRVEIVMGKLMEQGPVLIITFQSQQIMCVRHSNGAVAEGDPDKIVRMHHAWCLCRDPEELNPIAAWRVIELSMSASEQLI